MTVGAFVILLVELESADPGERAESRLVVETCDVLDRVVGLAVIVLKLIVMTVVESAVLGKLAEAASVERVLVAAVGRMMLLVLLSVKNGMVAVGVDGLEVLGIDVVVSEDCSTFVWDVF